MATITMTVINGRDVDSVNEDDNFETSVSEKGSTNECVESWAEWLIRTTRKIEEHCERLCIDNWVHQARALKWRLLERVQKQDCKRWSNRLYLWNPETMFDGLLAKAQRKRARPCMRWFEDINAFKQSRSTSDICENEFIHGTWREKRPGAKTGV